MIGRCVDSITDCGTCPAEFPFCLPGPLGAACAECRFDTDCATEGEFCQSGECIPCTTDKHCGIRCESCGGATPFCRDGQTAENSICVQCETDEQCPNGGSCDIMTNRCTPECSVSCTPDAPHCLGGDTCVECFADSHCPCQGTCDGSSNTCSSSCEGNADCQGTEHCAWNDDFDDKECTLGPNVGQSPCTAFSGCITPLACEVAVGHDRSDSLGGLLGAAFALFALVAIRASRRRREGGRA